MADELKAGRAFVDLIPRMTPQAAAGAQAQVGGLLAGIKGKAALAGAGIAGALAAPLSGLALFKLGENFNEQYRQIRIGTGTTGKVLEGLEQSFRNVAKSSAAPFAQTREAITSLYSRTNLTGAALETLATTEVRLARLTKAELGPQIAATTRLFGDWGVQTGDQVGALDMLFKVSQRTGIQVGTLSEKLVKFGAPFRQLGFSLEESAALIGKFEKEGVNVDLVLGSMRIALGKMARAGEPAQETFRRVTEEIQNAGTASEANALALELFGARAGPDMAAAIREGRFEIGELMDQIASSPETIAKATKETSTFSGKLSVLKNAVAVAFEPLATRVYQTLNRFATKALPFVISGVEKLATVIAQAGNILGDFLGLIGGWVGTVVRAFKVLSGDDGPQGFGEIMDNLLGNSGKYVSLFRSIGEGILDAVDKVRTGISRIVSSPAIRGIVDFLKKNLKPILISVAAVLGGAGLLGVIGLIGSAVSALAGVFVFLVGAIASPIVVIAALVAGIVVAYQRFEGFRKVVDTVVRFLLERVVPAIATFVGYVAEQFSKLVGWVEDHWEEISEVIEHAVNAVVEIVGRVIDVVVGAWRMFGDNILSIAKEVWDQIVLVVKTAVDLVRGVIEFVMAVINGDWGKAWDALYGIVKSILGLVVGTIENIVPTVVSLFSGAMELVIRAVETGLSKVVGFFVGLPGRFARAAGDLFGFIAENLKGALNAVISVWNDFKIPSVKIGGWDPPGPGPKVPAFHTPEINFPNLPLLADGGMALRAGLGIVGDDGPELAALSRGSTIVPLDVAAMIAEAARGADDRSLFRDVIVPTAADATADEVVDAIGAKLGWKLTTRRDR